jgi:hypothetical protein
MELCSRTKSGDAVRLVIEQDRHGVYQVYVDRMATGSTVGGRSLCHGWGVRKTPHGMVEGILVEGEMIEIPKEDWKEIVAAREDLRDREHLEGIRLVKVFSEGDRLTIDAYTLSAKVDRETWKKIESCMHFVDSADNDTLVAGDRFVGWVVEEGKEAEVERILGVKSEDSIGIGAKGVAP